MTDVRIDYEGKPIDCKADDRATHAVVSTDRDGDLRIQVTDRPVRALVRAQRAGDRHTRMTWIRRGKAVFTRVPEYDSSDSRVAAADRRSQRNQLAVLLAVLVLVTLAIVAL